MPHQCLGCGHSFAEGANELLKGCPSCQGTRFFYTPAPLGADGLAAKRGEAERDLRTLAEDPDLWSWSKRDEWVKFDAKKIDDTLSLFSEHRARATARTDVVVAKDPPVPPAFGGKLDRSAPPPEPTPVAPPPAESPRLPAEVAPAPAAPPPTAAERVASVRVDRPGTYDIDVKGLLDANPVVIEKDGVFMIHLPSVFDTAEKKR